MKETDRNEISPVSIIQQIKSGQFDPRLLKKIERQCCVEALSFEGFSMVSMAELLKCSTKTIQRDINDIYSRNISVPDTSFIKKCLGRLETVTAIHQSYLMRLARDKNASVSERAQAEYLAYKVIFETTKLYQIIGLLNCSITVGNRTSLGNHNANSSNPKSDITENEVVERVKHNLRTLIRYGDLSFEEIMPNNP